MSATTTTVPATIVVPDFAVEEVPAYGRAVEDGVVLASVDAYVLRIHSRHQGRDTDFALRFVNAAQGARRVTGGPVVHEDYAYLTALPTVVSAHRGADVTRVPVSVGDRIVFAGREWEVVEAHPLRDPELRLVGLTPEA